MKIQMLENMSSPNSEITNFHSFIPCDIHFGTTTYLLKKCYFILYMGKSFQDYHLIQKFEADIDSIELTNFGKVLNFTLLSLIAD